MSGGSRVLPLDAIRGILAVGVMTFHVAAWTGIGLITTLGTYWVYAFFVLSGFALDHVYRDRLVSAAAVGQFALARLARIWPLLAVATVLTAAAALVGGNEVDPVAVAGNLTGLFGLAQPGASQVAEGAWSLGIEAVFYAIFPILIVLRLGTRTIALLTAAALVLRFVWVDALWPPFGNFGTTWNDYTTVPSFLVFFLAGMLAARLRAAGPRVTSRLPFVVACVILLAVAGASALDVDQRELFAGPLSIALLVATCLVVGVGAFGPAWTGIPARIALLLGDTSYATYLLHPLVWGALALAGVGPLTLVVAPLLALAVHRWFERPAQRWIRSLGSRPGAMPFPAGESAAP